MHSLHIDSYFSVYKPKGDLVHLLLSGVSRRIAMVLLYIFSPIYIYLNATELGFSQSQAILVVLFFYLISYTVKLGTLVYSEDLSRKIGFKSTIRLSLVPYLVFILAMIATPYSSVMLLVAAVMMGMHTGFFWWGYHGYFIKTGESGHLGKSVGEADLLETTATVVTPIIGALIAGILGISVLFIVSAVFMVIAIILLGKDHERRQRRDVKFVEVLKLIKKHKYIAVAYVGVATDMVMYIVIWPVFLFLFFGEVLNLGIVVSASAFVAAIFSYIVGSRVDKQGERRVVSIGSPLVSISWFIKAFVQTLPVFIATDALRNFGQKMTVVPLVALTYKKGMESETARAILFLETSLIAGAILILLLLSIFVYLGGSLVAGFVAVSIFSLLPLIAVYKHKIHDAEK